MTARNVLLLLGGIAVLVASVYLVVEVRGGAVLASAPAVPAAASLPEAEHRGGLSTGSAAAATGAAKLTTVPAASQVPHETSGNDGDLDRANPSLDAVMDRANKAYDRGDFEEARAIALGLLAKSPTNVRMMRIVVSSACIEGDPALAQQWFDKLPKPDRDQMKIRCDRYGVTFREPSQ